MQRAARWDNPEPSVVLAINAREQVLGGITAQMHNLATCAPCAPSRKNYKKDSYMLRYYLNMDYF